MENLATVLNTNMGVNTGANNGALCQDGMSTSVLHCLAWNDPTLLYHTMSDKPKTPLVEWIGEL